MYVCVSGRSISTYSDNSSICDLTENRPEFKKPTNRALYFNIFLFSKVLLEDLLTCTLTYVRCRHRFVLEEDGRGCRT